MGGMFGKTGIEIGAERTPRSFLLGKNPGGIGLACGNDRRLPMLLEQGKADRHPGNDALHQGCIG